MLYMCSKIFLFQRFLIDKYALARGRVLLNLINNAFYVVSERSKKVITAYKPQVVVETKKHDNLIEIRVKDNADRIQDNIVNKIFQPFFTTKPTGKGTRKGLSLIYDIITKGHNGLLGSGYHSRRGDGVYCSVANDQ